MFCTRLLYIRTDHLGPIASFSGIHLASRRKLSTLSSDYELELSWMNVGQKDSSVFTWDTQLSVHESIFTW